jgi:hypothetical protein
MTNGAAGELRQAEQKIGNALHDAERGSPRPMLSTYSGSTAVTISCPTSEKKVAMTIPATALVNQPRALESGSVTGEGRYGKRLPDPASERSPSVAAYAKTNVFLEGTRLAGSPTDGCRGRARP